jgi:hypothetical protein
MDSYVVRQDACFSKRSGTLRLTGVLMIYILFTVGVSSAQDKNNLYPFYKNYLWFDHLVWPFQYLNPNSVLYVPYSISVY